MISIELITKDDPNLNKCIDAILNQPYKDYEIIINDASTKSHSVDFEGLGHVKYTYSKNANFLQARYIANKEAEGDYVLLLDSTRIIENNTLIQCSKLSEIYDMVIIPEIRDSKSKILRETRNSEINHYYIRTNSDPTVGLFLPRFYRKSLLDRVFTTLKKNLKENFENVCALEDRMIYTEALKISKKLGVANSIITHVEAQSLFSYLKKYYRYGKCNYYVYSEIDFYSYLASPYAKRQMVNPITYFPHALKDDLLLFLKSLSFLVGFFVHL